MEQEEEPPRDAPAFDFYCERWSHGTRHMTKVERCDYLDLLLHQWTGDGLPVDLDLMARLVGYRKGSQISPLVLEKFPIAEDGKRRNARLEKERVKQRVRIRGKRRGAAITNDKRRARSVASSTAPSNDELAALSATLSDADSATLSERSACGERDDIVTPPPTTHHPPQEHLTSSSLPPQGSGWPRTEEQCRSLAVSCAVDPDYAATIWNEHESSGDYSQKDQFGRAKPVFKFANYLKFRWACRSRKNDEAKALEKTKAELRKQGAYGSSSSSSGSKPSARDERGQRAGEIPTDVSVDKIKIYRLED